MTDETIHFDKCLCGALANRAADGRCRDCGKLLEEAEDDPALTLVHNTSGAISYPSDGDDLIGTSLDHFTILSKLGDGGMGSVYRAMDESLARMVAIKLIRNHSEKVAGNSESALVKSLLQEARAQARVSHPNVVHVYFISRDPKLPYLAMEIVNDGTLADRMKKGKLDFESVLGIGLQIANALKESSRLGIVHGDIKPSNILLDGDIAKLSDFGLAQRVSSKDAATGSLRGTPDYISPEVCRGEPPSTASDMYSFGVMLFEMTFGRLPYLFPDSNILSRLDAHQNRNPEFPSPWPNDTPRQWRWFLDKLLGKYSSDRFSSWDSLIDTMKRLRPLKPIIAGRAQRGIAWALDLLILVTATLMVMGGWRWLAASISPSSAILSNFAIAGGVMVPIVIFFWIDRGGISPGKTLMQLRVVDRFGLPVQPRILAWRSIIQFLPIWLFPTAVRTENSGLPDSVWQPLWIAMCIYFIADVVLAIVRANGKSLHDQLFGTRVVLVGAANHD